VLYTHSFSTQLFAIQLIDSVISISVIFKFYKTIAVLDENFTKFAIAAEESFNIALLHSVGQSTDVNTSPHGIN